MHGIWKAIGSFVRCADMILLSLCIAASVYGIVVISSATNVNGSAQYVRTQILALVLGIILYIVFTLIDVDIIAERRELLLIFSAIFILLLFPHNGTGQTQRQPLLAGVQLSAIFHSARGDLQNSVHHDSCKDHEHSSEQDLTYLHSSAAGSHHNLYVWPDRCGFGRPRRCAAVSVYFRHYGVCRRCEPSVVSGRICRPACSLTVFVAVSQL